MKIYWAGTIIKFTIGLPVLLLLSILKTWLGLVFLAVMLDFDMLDNMAKMWQPIRKKQ